MRKIESFTGEYSFLSNFYPSLIKYEGLRYATVEHAYQAAKAESFDVRVRFSCSAIKPMTAAQAKRAGRKIDLRWDWEDKKALVMRELLDLKFEDPILRGLLLDTGKAKLIEGNWWHDTYWGVCNGKGENMLGKILMAVREQIR